MLLLPIFSINLHWSVRFMPDFISMVLVCIAVGLSWNENRLVRSFLLATLGLLMKPTAIVVFALFLAHDHFIRKIWKVSGWVALSVGVAALYYTLGISWIEKYQELPLLFGVKARPILPGVIAFFQNWPTILKFYWERGFFTGGAVLVLGISIWAKVTRGTSLRMSLWGISLLQFFMIAVLDGEQLFYNHDYYLLSLSPLYCLLFVDAWQKCQLRWVRALLIVGICIPLIEACLVDLKTLFKQPKQPMWTLDRQCRTLIARHPEFPWGKGHVFRSPSEDYPMLGLYFGERQGSTTSGYGFYWVGSAPPPGCEKVDETESVALATCK
jgi:hypothetical protein